MLDNKPFRTSDFSDALYTHPNDMNLNLWDMCAHLSPSSLFTCSAALIVLFSEHRPIRPLPGSDIHHTCPSPYTMVSAPEKRYKLACIPSNNIFFNKFIINAQ